MSAAILWSDSHQTTLDDLLCAALPDVLPNHPRVASITPVATPGGYHASVRRITLSTGESVFAKRHLFARMALNQSYDLLAVEEEVTRLLAREKCHVPQVLGVIVEAGVVILRDVGRRTLDDAIQQDPPVKCTRLATEAVDAFAHIQKILATHPDTDRLVAPGCEPDSVRQSFLDVRSVLEHENLRALVCIDDGLSGILNDLGELVESLAEQPTLIGPTDYNARNIVISDTGSPFFLEWSKIGHDWPERRLVQYLTSLGTGQPGASHKSLIDQWLIKQYSEAAVWTEPKMAAFALDGHHLVFTVLAALRSLASDFSLSTEFKRGLTTPLSANPQITRLRKALG